MASFTNRGTKTKPSWQYTVSRMVNGKSDPIRKGGFKSKKEAQVAATEIEEKLNKGVAPTKVRKVTLEEYFESWLNIFKPGISDNTRARYLTTLETIKAEFPGTYVQDISKRSYQSVLNKYGESHGLATSKKLNSHIRACVKEAIDEGLISVDFTRGVKLTGEKPKKTEEKHLNFFESKRLQKYLLKNLDPKNMMNYLILLGLTTGLRFGELVGLTRTDFDFKKNRLNVDKVWGYNNKMKKGFGPTKNEQSVRVIKVDKTTMRIFKELFKETPDKPHGLVFHSTLSKYGVITNNGVNKVLKSILNELNIDQITVHGLRHTHISVLLYKRLSITYVSERAGHKDINTTLSTYAHVLKELREEDEEAAVAIFEEVAV
ncbi:site-specific integrase [Robertmurraya kyonggiensis]|uniref:Site-specific integrase n=1 Tax=Robertmurraya kyonggiensis TaxID=1037680 RepID=A0A4U1D0M8_9BACI|nr:tyrosine-type recombinase/integrase [Robertmurraya kyonggiensis]TKC15711.1 site-specific integrase [Robertmurraya kyonggiensis]